MDCGTRRAASDAPRLGSAAEGAPFAFLLAVLAVSGAAALGVEVVWARMLHRILGSTALSVAAVVAGFLGGLGLGAFAAERLLPRIRRTLGAYALAEVAAAGATCVFPAIAPVFEECLLVPGGETLVVLGVACLASPWGAMFPFVVEALRRRLPAERLGSKIRRVYGLNALGSAAGGLAAGLAGVPLLGELGVLALAAAAELAAALGAWTLAAADRGSEADLPAAEAPGEGLGGNPGWGSLAFLFASGLAVVYWEVLSTRILVLVVGATNYSFSAISSGVVAGIGLGSVAFGGKFLSRHAGWALPSLAALVLAAAYAAVPRLPIAYLAGVRTLGLPPLVAGTAGAAAAVFLPSVLLGCLVPWAISGLPRRAGSSYAANCAGSALGAFLGGPAAAAALSLEDAYRAGVSGLALVAVFGTLLARTPGRGAPSRARLALGTAAGLAAFGSVFAGLRSGPAGRPWDPKRLLSGVYQWSIEDLRTLPFETMLRSREILALEAGREVTVTVELDREANAVYVRGNGKVEGSLPADPSRPSRADMPTQLLLGVLPSWFLEGDRRPTVLLIGLGSGASLGALLRSGGGGPGEPEGLGPAPAAVDVLEVEEAYLRAIRRPEVRRYFEPFLPRRVLAGGGDLRARALPGAVPCRLHFGDARRLLAAELRRERWDAIASQPSEPWLPAAGGLFTHEFFDLAARRLAPDGVFVQWLQVYKLDLESVRLLVRTFRRVFPEVFLVRPPDTGELLLAGAFRRPKLERLLERPLEAWLLPARLETPADRLAVFVCGPDGVDAWVGLSPSLPVNRDSRSDLTYRAARSLYLPREALRKNVEALRRLAASDPISRYVRLDPGEARGLEARVRRFAGR